MHSRRTPLRLTAPLLFALASSLATSACDCGNPDWRNLMFEADIVSDSGAPLGSAMLTLSETRGEPWSRIFHLTLRGPVGLEPGPLGGHVSRVRLLGAADTVIRSHEFPLPGNPELLSLMLPETNLSQEAVTELRRALKAGDVVVELTTDLPGMTVLRIPMTMTMNGEWQAGSCMYT